MKIEGNFFNTIMCTYKNIIQVYTQEQNVEGVCLVIRSKTRMSLPCLVFSDVLKRPKERYKDEKGGN